MSRVDGERWIEMCSYAEQHRLQQVILLAYSISILTLWSTKDIPYTRRTRIVYYSYVWSRVHYITQHYTASVASAAEQKSSLLYLLRSRLRREDE